MNKKTVRFSVLEKFSTDLLKASYSSLYRFCFWCRQASSSLLSVVVVHAGDHARGSTHDSKYHAAANWNEEGKLHNDQFPDRLTVLSPGRSLATLGIREVDRLIQLACIAVLVESADGGHDGRGESCAARAAQAACGRGHRRREEEAQRGSDEETGIDHVDDAAELVNLAPVGGHGFVVEDPSAVVVRLNA